MAKSREEMVERLRGWSARALHEAQYADTQERCASMAGSGAVLGGVANYITDQSDADDFATGVRWWGTAPRASTEWMMRQDGADGALYAGQVAGFDVAMTVLKDPEARNWPKYEPHAN